MTDVLLRKRSQRCSWKGAKTQGEIPIYKLRREASEETKLANCLGSDIQPPELCTYISVVQAAQSVSSDMAGIAN